MMRNDSEVTIQAAVRGISRPKRQRLLLVAGILCVSLIFVFLSFVFPAYADSWSQTTFTNGTFTNTVTTIGAADVVLDNATVITYNYTGGQQSWVVPAGVISITVDAKGARGGFGWQDDTSGGNGARVQTTIAVTPGQTLYIYVGGAGADWDVGGGGYNGGGSGGSGGGFGGGGGGASDIRQGGTALANRVVIAGGGGGAAYLSNGGAGGQNGSAGESGGSGGGGGGTQAAGGTGGWGDVSGSAGVLGVGGTGANDYIGQGDSGGGGGGGYYGGGGGGFTESSGGGGGSSKSSGASTTFTSGYQNGNGQVIISYAPSPGNYISPAIEPAGISYWGVLTYTKTTPTSTVLTVDVLKSSDNSLLVANVASGTNLSVSYPVTFSGITGVKLRANLSSSDPLTTSMLSAWGLEYGAGPTVTTTNWTDLAVGASSVKMGQSIAYVKFDMKATDGTIKWKKFRINKGVGAYAGIACPDSKIEVQVWMENNSNGFWDSGDAFISKGAFTGGVCYLNMKQWEVTTDFRTYYIVYKLANDIGGGQRAGVEIVDNSYLEFENATCVGVP
ncbi:MAG: hypothetical protein HY811_04000 [Planctomycetes bacterium]|nr:hypothetical protein [Planctomycetota bacterium]